MEEEYQVLNRYGSGHRRNDGNYVVEILYVAFYVVLYMICFLVPTTDVYSLCGYWFRIFCLFYLSGFYIGKTSEKLHPIENPQDIIVQSAGPMVRELFWSLLSTLEPIPLLENTLLVYSPIRCIHYSVSPCFWFLLIHVPTTPVTWILCVPVCCRPLRKVDTFLFLVMWPAYSFVLNCRYSCRLLRQGI